MVPGHGPIANRDDLVNFHDTLRTIEGRVQRLIAAGSSVAEILAADSLPMKTLGAQIRWGDLSAYVDPV